jgi:hypothetical protein
MPHIDKNRRRSAPAAAATGVVTVLLLACLGLAACGGSSSSSSTNASASATASTGAAGLDRRLGAQDASRFKALRECLQKNGVTLPKRAPGRRRGGAGGPSGPGGFLGAGAGGPQLPSGVTRAQLQAAIKKCGGGVRGQFQRRVGRLKNPAYQAALAKFAACMRENGMNVPAPNTSGNGPIFSTKGLNTARAQFQAAEAKCRSALAGALDRGPGVGATGAAGTAPPGGSAAG